MDKISSGVRERRTTPDESQNGQLESFDREKWEAEQRGADRDFALRERELALREVEARRARWWNPLAIAIMGAAVAAGGSALVSWQNNKASLQVEAYKEESARILAVVKTGNPDLAARNLNFLLEIGLIQNPETAKQIRQYIEGRKSGEGIALPPEDRDVSSNIRDYNSCRVVVLYKLIGSIKPGTSNEATENALKVMVDTAARICGQVHRD